MKTIIFVRHGAVTYTENPIVDLQVYLNELGKKQVLELSELFREYVNGVGEIYCSGLNRTKETLAHIASYYKLDLIDRADLNEHNYNGNAGLFHTNLKKDPSFKFSGGESIEESGVRFERAIGEILNKNQDKLIIIGTHGTIFSNYLIKKFNLDSDYFFKLSYPDVYELSYDENHIPISYKKRPDLIPNNAVDKI